MFPNPTNLLEHIKNQKSDIGEYQCSLCNSSFDQLCKLGRHLSTCFKNNETTENVFVPTIKKEFLKFQELSHGAAFDFALKLAKNMSVPRNSVFEVIGYVQKFLESIGEGMQHLVIPLLKGEKVHEFENVVSIMVNESFKKVNTESKLDKCLSDAKLISPLRKVPLKDPDPSIMDVDEDETSEADDDYICNEDDSNGDSDVSGGDDSDPGGDDGSKRSEPRKPVLMDVRFQIKSFFEMPGVFDKIKSNTDNIRKTNKLNHFINGKVWKKKLQHFKKDDIVIPYHLHIDDTQTNNPLGSHVTNGDQTCVYYSFPTIPNEYLARLDTIFTALLFESSLSKDYGNEKCYEALIEDLNTLVDDALVLNIDGKEQKVFFVVGLLLGDNKGLNNCLGFPRGFKANYYCRLCRLHRTQMQYSYREDVSNLRNKENYEEDLSVGDMTLTGIYEDSPFNKLRYFHATDSCADIMHDINEGILHYNICEVILNLIKRKYFNLSMLNEEKRKKKYGEIEENNKSWNIKMKSLKGKKLKMTASESYSFVHHLPFIILNIINEEDRETLQNDEVWRFLLITIR